MDILKIFEVVLANPFMSLFLLAATLFLAVASAKILGVTRVGPVVMSNYKVNIVSELIREITRLEVERQLAPSKAKGECRRIVKDASDQTKAILRGTYEGSDFRTIDTMLAGPVNTFIVGEVMTMVEKDKIAELDREVWNARKKDEFRAKMIGLKQVLGDFWPKDDVAGACSVEDRVTGVTVELFYAWDSMFERIRTIMVEAAERSATISKQIDYVMNHYKRHGKYPPKGA
jgi:hypothetical protein